MNLDTIKKQVRDEVEDFLDSKEKSIADENFRKDVEDKIETATSTINDLNEQLAKTLEDLSDKAKAVEDLESQNQSLTASLEEKDQKISALEKDVLDITARAEKAELEMDTFRKEKVLEERVSKLDELRILRSGDALEKQKASVREMSEEEFASYTEDLVALREDLVKEIKAEATPKEETEKEAASDNDVGTPPMDVDALNKDNASILPNLVATTSTTSTDKATWQKWGDSLAARMKTNRNS